MGPSRPKCKIDGCKRLEQNIGLCNYHYTKKKERDTSRPKCKIDGCKKRTYAQEMCSYHFNRESKKNLRGKLFKILGGKKCVECGYSNELALAFDHIHDDGYKDRKIRILDYRKYINSPSLALERLQVLCANCNHIKLVKNGKWYE